MGLFNRLNRPSRANGGSDKGGDRDKGGDVAFKSAWRDARASIEDDSDFTRSTPGQRLEVLQKVAVTLFLERQRNRLNR